MRTILTAALLALAPLAAQADQIRLDKPMQGATLTESGIDLTAYWTEEGDMAHVTAAYVTSWDDEGPAHVQMQLAEGDAVTFALPDARHIAFTFLRMDGAVHVRSTPLADRLASR